MTEIFYKGLKLTLLCLLILMISTACENGDENEITDNKYKNGTYTGYSDATDHGYAYARVEIQADDITAVELMEITEMGNEKDYETYDYEPSVQAYKKMPERFVEADSAEVDTYTGATHSSEKFIQAVKRALDYAEGGLEGGYYDGKFQGESNRSEYGHAVALVTIKDDKMQDVELKETNGEGEWKDYSTYEYEPAVEAYEEMPERFVEANSPDVDMYNGATQSSIRYKEAVERALKHARKKPEADEEE